jgi:precorrin-3B methylase
LTIVSLGPGFLRYLVPAALEALTSAQVLVGYKMYLDLIGDLVAGKEVLASGMRKEVERCGLAIDQALAGKRVALVSSGDAGIFGMAGLVFDLCRERNLRVARLELTGPGLVCESDLVQPDSATKVDFWIDVVPGVPAFNAASAILGAPLMHDFAAVSLSDHLTPWELIEKRLRAAAMADFVLALYNPRSKTRPHGLQRVLALLLQHRPATTPVGIVGRAMREGQWHRLTTLGEMSDTEVDMQSMVIIGNSQTYIWHGWMVTPRGYLDKYTLEGELAGTDG